MAPQQLVGQYQVNIHIIRDREGKEKQNEAE